MAIAARITDTPGLWDNKTLSCRREKGPWVKFWNSLRRRINSSRGFSRLTCGEHLIPLLAQELAETVRRERFACRRDKRPELVRL
jgi:hypothetical protein